MNQDLQRFVVLDEVKDPKDPDDPQHEYGLDDGRVVLQAVISIGQVENYLHIQGHQR